MGWHTVATTSWRSSTLTGYYFVGSERGVETHFSNCKVPRFIRCDEAFNAAKSLDISTNLWSALYGNFYYGLEIFEQTTARKFAGECASGTKQWCSTQITAVQCGWGGLTPEEFGWRLDRYRLTWGVGIRFGGKDSPICPVYMSMPAPQTMLRERAQLKP
jgi:hypothetical protein